MLLKLWLIYYALVSENAMKTLLYFFPRQSLLVSMRMYDSFIIPLDILVWFNFRRNLLTYSCTYIFVTMQKMVPCMVYVQSA